MTPQDGEFVTADEVLALVPFPMQRRSMVRMAGNGGFPEPIKINRKHWLWRKADVVRWIAERMNRDGKKHTPRDDASREKVARRAAR